MTPASADVVVDNWVDVGFEPVELTGPKTLLPDFRSSSISSKPGLFAPKPAAVPGRRLNQQRVSEVKLSMTETVALYPGAACTKTNTQCQSLTTRPSRYSRKVHTLPQVVCITPEIEVWCWERRGIGHIDCVHFVVYLFTCRENEHHPVVRVVILPDNHPGHQRRCQQNASQTRPYRAWRPKLASGETGHFQM